MYRIFPWNKEDLSVYSSSRFVNTDTVCLGTGWKWCVQHHSSVAVSLGKRPHYWLNTVYALDVEVKRNLSTCAEDRTMIFRSSTP